MEQTYRVGRALRCWFFKAIPLMIVLAIAYQPFFLFTHVDAAPQPSKEDLLALQNRIKALQDELAAKEVHKVEATDALQESERAISEINSVLVKLAKQQTDANNRLNELMHQTRQLEEELNQQTDQLGSLLYHQYINNRSSNFHLLLNLQDPNHIARNLYYYRYLKQARVESIVHLQQYLHDIEMLKSESRVKQDEIAKVQAEQTQQKKILDQEKAKRATVLANLSEKISLQQHELSKLKADEQRLAKLVEQINQFLAKSKRDSDTASTSANAPLLNNKTPDSTVSGYSFTSLRGKLRLPVRGELVNRFDSPRQEGGIKWRGLFIRAKNGNEVKAIASGQVVFADWLRGFGNLMIVDHGSSYMSLYGYNEAIYRRVGDKVQGGDTIAIVGNSGGSSESGLYFELRHQGKPFDPLTWVKIE
ncbi:MAG TPA: peptidoglycan DD-metalloendopeptidase family protein [Nitrosomonas sp.]|nr:peptidoglycan DD-metalloendopeptidase family protein [Nitrosomonas sp.]